VDVKCRFTRSTETVKVARGAKCYLDQEHSFLRCTLRVAGSSFKKILYPLFESAVAADRSSGLSSRGEAAIPLSRQDTRYWRQDYSAEAKECWLQYAHACEVKVFYL
jgi:hypothetical protein